MCVTPNLHSLSRGSWVLSLTLIEGKAGTAWSLNLPLILSLPLTISLMLTLTLLEGKGGAIKGLVWGGAAVTEAIRVKVWMRVV